MINEAITKKDLQEIIGALERKVDARFDMLNNKFDLVDNKFDKLEALMMQGFEIVHTRFDRLETRLERIEISHGSRIRALESKL